MSNKSKELTGKDIAYTVQLISGGDREVLGSIPATFKLLLMIPCQSLAVFGASAQIKGNKTGGKN